MVRTFRKNCFITQFGNNLCYGVIVKKFCVSEYLRFNPKEVEHHFSVFLHFFNKLCFVVKKARKRMRTGLVQKLHSSCFCHLPETIKHFFSPEFTLFEQCASDRKGKPELSFMLVEGIQKSPVCREVAFTSHSFKNLPVPSVIKVTEKPGPVIRPEPAQPERLMHLKVHAKRSHAPSSRMALLKSERME